MNDIRNESFWKENFSTEELEQLWNWITTGGNAAIVKPSETGKRYEGYHVLDTEFKIDLVSMPTKRDCVNWLTRLGFTV